MSLPVKSNRNLQSNPIEPLQFTWAQQQGHNCMVIEIVAFLKILSNIPLLFCKYFFGISEILPRHPIQLTHIQQPNKDVRFLSTKGHIYIKWGNIYIFFFKFLKALAEAWLFFLNNCDHPSEKWPLTQWLAIEISLGHSGPFGLQQRKIHSAAI